MGQARAQSLGWPDAYPYTKALGERALVSEYGRLVPMTIIRPSIIESALAEPRPGWIRGFRMAEPIIVSYARGLLREFPGVPEGVTDVIPVDLVVAAILVVAGETLVAPAEEYQGPSVYHVASGVRNPFRYGRLVELVQGWFTRAPPLRLRRTADRGTGMVVSRTRTGAAPTVPGQQGDGVGRKGGGLPPHPRTPGRLDGRSRGTTPAGRPCARLRRALRRVHRDRGPLPGRSAHGAVGSDGPRRPPAVLPRPRRSGLGHLRPGHPPAIDHRARPGSHHTGKVEPAEPGRTGPQGHPLPRSPPGRVRSREHPHRLQRGRLLRLAGLAAPAQPANGSASWPTWCERPPACWCSTDGTAGTSSAPSIAATRVPRWIGFATTGGSSSINCYWPSPFPPASPGSGDTGPSAIAPS